MAIIIDGATCALCDKVIDSELIETDQFVATTAFVDDATSPFWEFSDAPMHKECFMAWPLKSAFIQAHNEAMKDTKDRHGLHWHMTEDGEIESHNDAGQVVPIDEEEEAQFIYDYLVSIGCRPLE